MMHNVLVIAAHSDDEVLGCGGTIAKLVECGSNVSVMFLTDGVGARLNYSTKDSAKDRSEAAKKAAKILGVGYLKNLNYPDNALDSVPLLEIVRSIESVILEVRPDTIFTHFLYDLNIDHSVVARAAITATRPHVLSSVKRVLGFEVNSSTEWAFGEKQFSPNYFVNISLHMEKKLKAIRAYEAELRQHPHPRSLDGIKSLASLRGSSSGYEYAEAYQIYRFMED